MAAAGEVPKRARKDAAASATGAAGAAGAVPTFDVGGGGGGLARPSKPSGLKMPEGLGGLSVEVAPELGDVGGAGAGQLSVSSLSNAPLSAILGAFGFGSVPPSATMPPPSASFAGPLSPGFPPLSALGGPAHTPLFGLSPRSMNTFVGDSALLLEEALDAPLSSQLSHSRKSPRLFPPELAAAGWA